MRDRQHHYRVATCWTGNLGSGTSAYSAYSRNYELSAPGKSTPIGGSSDPAFRGDPTRYNPEELLLGAVSACHMLWVLHLCADAGIAIADYRDESEGFMVEHTDGSGEFARVVLRPRMTIADAARASDAAEIHRKAHALCALARSVKFEVVCEPVIEGLGVVRRRARREMLGPVGSLPNFCYALGISMRGITIKILEIVARRLRDEARQSGRSVAALIHERIEAPRRDGESIYAVSSDLAGSLDGGQLPATNAHNRFRRE